MHADVCESPDCTEEAQHLWKDGPWFMLLCPTHFEQEEAKRLTQHRARTRTRTR